MSLMFLYGVKHTHAGLSDRDTLKENQEYHRLKARAVMTEGCAERGVNDPVFLLAPVFYREWFRVRSFFLFIHSVENNIL